MVRIGIDLNNCYRDINAEILKMVSKYVNPLLYPEDCNSKNMVVVDDYVDVDKSLVNNLVGGKFRFESLSAKNKFLYEDYPYEVFGCAKLAERNLDVKLNQFVEERCGDDFEFSFFSTKEAGLTIQSSCYFLSKTSGRLRRILFPKSFDEAWDEFDVIVTTNNELIEGKPESKWWNPFSKRKKVVKIARPFNKGLECDLEYDSIGEMLEDKEFLKKLK